MRGSGAHAVLAAALALALGACGSAPAVPLPPGEAWAEELLAIALRHLVETTGERGAVVFVSMRGGDRDLDPPPRLLARLRRAGLRAYPGSLAALSPRGVTDRHSGQLAAVLIRLGELVRADLRTAEVEATLFRSRIATASYRVRLALVDGHWQVDEEQPLWTAQIAELPPPLAAPHPATPAVLARRSLPAGAP
ncbi:MAG: hypothetical protein KatS3mg102_0859 [Planctomycetota bacterium]|nr:MAG: hypothetical protein KatS3mg102_0859 [Planctomycetota bacterium]